MIVNNSYQARAFYMADMRSLGSERPPKILGKFDEVTGFQCIERRGHTVYTGMESGIVKIWDIRFPKAATHILRVCILLLIVS